MRKFTILFLLAAFPIMGMGCQACHRMTGMKMVDAQYKPNKRKMLIMPFSDPVFGCFESREGSELSRDLGDYIRWQRITDVMYDTFFPASMQKLYEEKRKEGNETQALMALAKEMDCELIVTGQIHDYQAGGDRSVNIESGTVTFEVQAYDAGQPGAMVWRMPVTTVTFPEGWEYADLPRGDMPTDKLSRMLLNKAAEKIGQCFHDHLEKL
ncbi:MAG TPA: hypothetical protein VM186_11620 [Planctomycetota bacterium]|nr:hypothetical protein [Planctomycetota bacterium]